MDAADQCDAVADRLADEDAAEEAAQIKGQEATAQHRAALMQALTQPEAATVSLDVLAEAVDDGTDWDGGPEPLALIDAVRGNPAGLLKWMERVAFARAADQHGKRVELAAIGGAL